MSDTKVIFEKSVKGRMGASLPKLDVPKVKFSDIIPQDLLREKMANLPEVSEPQVVRHYVNLSTKNHHVDKDFYPLGSCTMKYNPKINDALASLPGFKDIHPEQPAETVQLEAVAPADRRSHAEWPRNDRSWHSSAAQGKPSGPASSRRREPSARTTLLAPRRSLGIDPQGHVAQCGKDTLADVRRPGRPRYDEQPSVLLYTLVLGFNTRL